MQWKHFTPNLDAGVQDRYNNFARECFRAKDMGANPVSTGIADVG
jgi:hypothetical protein